MWRQHTQYLYVRGHCFFLFEVLIPPTGRVIMRYFVTCFCAICHANDHLGWYGSSNRWLTPNSNLRHLLSLACYLVPAQPIAIRLRCHEHEHEWRCRWAIEQCRHPGQSNCFDGRYGESKQNKKNMKARRIRRTRIYKLTAVQFCHPGCVLLFKRTSTYLFSRYYSWYYSINSKVLSRVPFTAADKIIPNLFLLPGIWVLL